MRAQLEKALRNMELIAHIVTGINDSSRLDISREKRIRHLTRSKPVLKLRLRTPSRAKAKSPTFVLISRFVLPESRHCKSYVSAISSFINLRAFRRTP